VFILTGPQALKKIEWAKPDRFNLQVLEDLPEGTIGRLNPYGGLLGRSSTRLGSERLS